MDSDPGTRETPNMNSVCIFRFAERCVLFLCGVRCLLSAAVKNVFFPCDLVCLLSLHRVYTVFTLVSMIRWSFSREALLYCHGHLQLPVQEQSMRVLSQINAL